VLWTAAVSAADGPSAQQIFFRRAGRLMRFDVSGRFERVLWPQTGRDEDGAPAVSADGATVFFGFGGNLWAIPAAGGAPRRVTRLGQARAVNAGAADTCDNPCPSPDGRFLAYRFTAADGHRCLRLVDLGDETDRLVANGPEGPATWSPDSTRLLFTVVGQLWQYDSTRGQLRPCLPDADGVAQPRFLADGRLLLLRDGLATLLRPDGAATWKAPAGFDGQLPWPAPDGRSLALVRRGEEPGRPGHSWSEIHVLPLGEPRVRLVLSTFAPHGVNGHATLLGWFDARRLLVLRDLNEGCRKIYAVQVDTSNAELIFKGQDRDDGFAVWPS
jgi:hypothetical protein